MSVLFATRFPDHSLNSGGWSVHAVHGIVVRHADPINPNKNRELIFQSSLRPVDSNAGLKIHIGDQGCHDKTEVITSDVGGVRG